MSVASDLFVVAPDDVHALYTRLREDGLGVHRLDPLGMVLVLRYADIAEMYRRPGVFSSDCFEAMGAGAHDPEDPVHRRFMSITRNLLLFQDPPVHTRLRGLVSRAFTPKAVAAMRDAAERVADELLDELAELGRATGEVEFMKACSEPLPIWVIAELVGVPVADRAQFKVWSYHAAFTLDPTCVGEARNEAIRHGAELADYLDRLIEQRRGNPGDDLVSLLITAQQDGGRLTGEELTGMLIMLLVAGNETTSSLISNGLALLLDHPEQRRLLTDRPELTEGAIEEMLRYEPPLRWNARVTTEAVRLGGIDLAPGQVLFLCIASANRDPDQFADPHRFDVTRAHNRHLTFGMGAHFCLGAPLARLEARIVLPKLLARFPEISSGSGERAYKPDFIARTMSHFPVRLG